MLITNFAFHCTVQPDETPEESDSANEPPPPVIPSSTRKTGAKRAKPTQWDALMIEELDIAKIKKENLLLKQEKLRLEIQVLEKQLKAPANLSASDAGTS